MTCSLPLTIEQAVEAPALKVMAPPPEPPLVVIVASASPNVAAVGAVIVRAAWLALLMTISVRVCVDGPVTAEPSHAPPLAGIESVPVTWNVYVPAAVEPEVVTLSVEVAELLVVWTGLVPNTAVAPVGSAGVTLRVVLQGLLFPPATTVTVP